MKWAFILSVAFMYATMIAMYITFLAAYYNGGEILVVLDRYGEANTELYLITPMVIGTTISCLWAARGIKNE